MGHHIDKFSEKSDEIATKELWLMVAYLNGKITLKQAVCSSHAYEAHFLRMMQLSIELGVMCVENDEEINNILNGAD